MAERETMVAASNYEARERLVARLRQLWHNDPAGYWKAFRASGLIAKDIWPNAIEYVEPDKLKNVPKKQPGKMSK